MRNKFAEKLTELATFDDRVILLSGDIGNRLFDNFKTAFPERFFNCGVAEQNMTGVAAGLAKHGFIPITYTIAPFCTTRCLEQIKIDVAYHNLPVIIVSVGAGLSYAGLGPTHHALEDIAFLRTIPNMRIVCPSDAYELQASMDLMVHEPQPTYIRMGKKGEPLIHKNPIDKDQLRRPIILTRGRDICLVASGVILSEVVRAAQLLEDDGYSVTVISLAMLKPFPEDELLDLLLSHECVAVIEEHALAGGVSSAVSELLIDKKQNLEKFLRFGVADDFYVQAGSRQYALEQLGLSAEAIKNRICSKLGSETHENTLSYIGRDRKASRG
jgi:transketolase